MATTRRPEVVAGWAAALPRTAASHLGSLRNRGDFEVCDDGPLVWLRSSTSDEAIERQLRSILGCRAYRVLNDGQLVPHGAAVPRGFVPGGTWSPLAEWLTLTIPPTRRAAKCGGCVGISLVRSSHSRDPSLVQLSLGAWEEYATTAPQVRLARLRFAASGQRVVVEGVPLPPVRGEYFWVEEGIAAPVGYGWQPALDARVLRQALALDAGDVALLMLEGNLERICADQFAAATPSAIRLTVGESHVDR